MKRRARPDAGRPATYPALREVDRRFVLGLAGAAVMGLAAGCVAEASGQVSAPRAPVPEQPTPAPETHLRGEPPAIDLPRPAAPDAGVPVKAPPPPEKR